MVDTIPEWWMQQGPSKKFLAHRSELHLWPSWPRRPAVIGEVTRKGIREVGERIRERAEVASDSSDSSGQSKSSSSADRVDEVTNVGVEEEGERRCGCSY